MDEEVQRSGTLALPPGCEWIRLPLFERLQEHWPDPADRTPPSTAQHYFEMLEIGRPSVVRIVDLLGTADVNPTLIHCVAGRDRTGIVVACVLDLLDVPDEVIATDYALSSVVDDEEGRNASPENILLLHQLVRMGYGSVHEMLLASGAAERSMEELKLALVA